MVQPRVGGGAGEGAENEYGAGEGAENEYGSEGRAGAGGEGEKD